MHKKVLGHVLDYSTSRIIFDLFIPSSYFEHGCMGATDMLMFVGPDVLDPKDSKGLFCDFITTMLVTTYARALDIARLQCSMVIVLEAC